MSWITTLSTGDVPHTNLRLLHTTENRQTGRRVTIDSRKQPDLVFLPDFNQSSLDCLTIVVGLASRIAMRDCLTKS